MTRGAAVAVDAIGAAQSFRGQHVGKAMLRQLRDNVSALQISTLVRK